MNVPLTKEQKVWNIIGLIVIGLVICIFLVGNEDPTVHKICYGAGVLVFGLFMHDWKYGRVPKTKEEIGREGDEWSDPVWSSTYEGLPGNVYTNSSDDLPTRNIFNDD